VSEQVRKDECAPGFRVNVARRSSGATVKSNPTSPRPLAIFADWRLRACGYALAIVYGATFYILYKTGVWLIDANGTPLPEHDFEYWWVAGMQALHGQAASLYDPVQLRDLLEAPVGADHARRLFYPNCPYPPIFLLVLAPLATLPYVTSFLAWETVTLSACVAVVLLIVRQPAAIALTLASPLGALDFRWGQTGFLGASLLGAALLALERQPVLAGVFFGCLTFKPQFGIMIPVALVAAKQWRAFASSALTAVLLAGVSIAAFGIAPWEAFPRGLLAQAGDVLIRESERKATWSSVQTVYGFVRTLDGGPSLAWFAQACTTVGMAIVVWLVWRSAARFGLKAALLSAATLIATPYAWAHDLTVIAIPIAFLARDQIEYGLLRGEQTTILALFGAALAILVSGGWALPFPLGPVIMVTLVAVILRRVLHDGGEPQPAALRRLEPSQGMPRSASS
jgi:arabinofuranan 3-O-arabinosyltransferase